MDTQMIYGDGLMERSKWMIAARKILKRHEEIAMVNGRV
jgi:uncharacterized protein YqgQ